MSQAITAARPYALAAFEEAQTNAALTDWSEVLGRLADAVENPELLAVIGNPSTNRAQLEALMLALAGESAMRQQKNFVRLLVEGGRLNVLPEISAMFEQLKAEAEKTENVMVDSAFELSSEQQNKIAASLKKRLGCEVNLVCNVNKALLGGVVIRAGDKVIDGSARTRLVEMAHALA